MSEWINIKEKLPAEMEVVIIATLYGVTFGCLANDAGLRFWSWDRYDFLDIDLASVTHWMPFPEPPQ